MNAPAVAVTPPYVSDVSAFVLSDDQQRAYDGIAQFVMSPASSVFVLSGYAGTGKSTLVRRVIEDVDNWLKTLNLLLPGEATQWSVELTATTNKAAEALSGLTNRSVKTIQSFLGARVHKDYATGKTRLVLKSNAEMPENRIIVIDEASYIDTDLMKLIFNQCDKCKLLFIGDPAQLLAVNSAYAPVFANNFTGAELTKVMRQAEGNPIIDLAAAFRETVNTGEFFSFQPDGKAILYLDDTQFEQAIIDEFSRPDWDHNDSKVLAWTNKTVIRYNQGIRNAIKGGHQLHAGDYAICNQFYSYRGISCKTDEMVQVTKILPAIESGVDGFLVEVNKFFTAFMPASPEAAKQRLKKAQADEDYTLARKISEAWIDLRAAYACTVNKSQGSTYDKVFIDLNDLRSCRNSNQLARMLYVAVSRARHQVIFTGDIV